MVRIWILERCNLPPDQQAVVRYSEPVYIGRDIDIVLRQHAILYHFGSGGEQQAQPFRFPRQSNWPTKSNLMAQ
jgi:hypothetical protein